MANPFLDQTADSIPDSTEDNNPFVDAGDDSYRPPSSGYVADTEGGTIASDDMAPIHEKNIPRHVPILVQGIDLNYVLKFLFLFSGLANLGMGIFSLFFLPTASAIQTAITSIWLIIFGILILWVEIRGMTRKVLELFGFFKSYTGRGIFIFFCGSTHLGILGVWGIVFGIILMVFGSVAVLLVTSFKSVEGYRMSPKVTV